MSTFEIAVGVSASVQPMIVGALPESTRLFVSHESRLGEFLDRSRSIAAIFDRTFVDASLGRRLCKAERLGVRWPALQILGREEGRSAGTEGWAAGVLTPDECQIELHSVLVRRIAEWQLASAATRAEDRFRTSAVMLKLLRVLLLRRPPVTTVAQLEAITRAGHTSLYAVWNESMRPRCGLTLGLFIDWVALLRSLGVKAPHWGWNAVAPRVGLSRHGLVGLVNRVGQCELDELDNRGLELVIAFITRVLAPCGLAPAG